MAGSVSSKNTASPTAATRGHGHARQRHKVAAVVAEIMRARARDEVAEGAANLILAS
jgi:hypothetical protein